MTKQKTQIKTSLSVAAELRTTESLKVAASELLKTEMGGLIRAIAFLEGVNLYDADLAIEVKMVRQIGRTSAVSGIEKKRPAAKVNPAIADDLEASGAVGGGEWSVEKRLAQSDRMKAFWSKKRAAAKRAARTK